MFEERLKNAPILIVDDQQPNVELLESFLDDDGYTNFTGTTDSRRALSLFESLQPDLLLLDLHMPPPDGFEVMRQLKTLASAETYLPILVLTADTTSETKQRALSAGAKDFLAKPLDIVEVQLRIRNLLETRLLHLQLQKQNLNLKGEVRASNLRFRTLAETASDAIITFDEAGRIVFNNPAAEHVFDYAPDELIGVNITALIPEHATRTTGGGGSRDAARRSAGQPDARRAVVELTGRRADGLEVPLEISAGEFEQDGRRFHTLIARDTTERKRAEEELRREREARLVALERVRTRIATDLHDDIGASLSRMAIMSEVAKRRLAPDDGAPIRMLDEIADSARALLDSMSDIVWAVDPRRDDLRSVVQRIRQFASDVLEGRGIRWDFRVPADVEELKLGPDERRHLFLIFKEAINNIARHAAEVTSATLSIYMSGDQLVGEIRDDGRGFALSSMGQAEVKSRGGHGLPNMQARAVQLGGSLKIESQPGAGTSLTLKFPLKT